MNSRARVLVVGSLNEDVILALGRLPALARERAHPRVPAGR
ncbi:MAG TPA: hypothetical protein VFN55_05005 [Solirubrobacteraceae bacterium]|nr:hypothetical protein [Solirubrobacteraceae bacterium]